MTFGKVRSIEEAEPGDLIFWQTAEGKRFKMVFILAKENI